MPAGSLTLWRWHARSCPHRTKGRRWTRCNCGIWVQGSLGGEWIKRSLNTRDWSAAAAIVHGWEASGQVGVIKVDIPTVEQAVERYFEDATARHLAETTHSQASRAPRGQAPAVLQGEGLQPPEAADVARAPHLPQWLAVLRALRGEASGVPPRLLAILQGLWLDRRPIRRWRSSRRRSRSDRRCRSRTPMSNGF